MIRFNSNSKKIKFNKNINKSSLIMSLSAYNESKLL